MKKLIAVVFAVILFASCSKENEEPTPTSTPEQMIVGKWQLSTFDGTNVASNLIFNQYYSDGVLVLSSPSIITAGAWSLQGDHVIVDWDDYPTSTILLESLTTRRLIEIEEGHRLVWIKK